MFNKNKNKKEIKQDLNSWKEILWLWIGKLNITKISISSS